MQKLFTKILVPVNSGRNNRLALDKALQLANRFNCNIHLLQVETRGSIPFLHDSLFGGPFAGSSRKKNVNQLKELEDRSRRKLHNGLITTSAFITGNWQTLMKQTIITEHIDLVVISNSRRKFSHDLTKRIDLNSLSQQTRCPILTVTRKSNLGQLQNIVVPVNEFLPVKKLTLATYLCQDLHGTIHLMENSGNSSGDQSQNEYLIKAYQLLRDYGQVKIHCALPDNYDSPTSTLTYAKNVKADLIVVNSGKESLLRGWWNKVMGNYLFRESDIPVLTIASPQEQRSLIAN